MSGELRHTLRGTLVYWRVDQRVVDVIRRGEAALAVGLKKDGSTDHEWQFTIWQTSPAGRGRLHLDIWSHSWGAFEDVPELFGSLGAGEFEWLEEVIEILDYMGFLDATAEHR